MALSMHAALPRIVPPAFLTLSNRNNYRGHKHYSSFSLTRLYKASSPVLIPAVQSKPKCPQNDVLPLGKVAADFALLLDSSNVAPFRVIVVFFEFMASMIMLDLLPDNSSYDQKATSADETLISVSRRRRRRIKT